MLTIVNLSFDYQQKPLLKNIQFSLSAGQLLHIRGGNGSGKTTLLQLLAGLRQPDKGNILYNGETITKNLGAYQRELCYVGHKTGLNPMLTVRENCFFASHWRQNDILENLLKQFNLQELADVFCHALSAGQQRRVSLLRLALSTAKIWLLDEPLIALDSEAVGLLMTLLKNHLFQGGIIVLTSHQQLSLSEVDYLEYLL